MYTGKKIHTVTSKKQCRLFFVEGLLLFSWYSDKTYMPSLTQVAASKIWCSGIFFKFHKTTPLEETN